MKKTLCALLSASLLLALNGCGDQESSGTAAQQPESSAAEIAEEASGAAAEADASADGTENATETESTAETTAESDDSYLIDTTTLTEATLTVEATIDRDGVYTTKDDVALYIYTYGELPSNFITKKDAQALGWTGGSLEPYAPGKCIGGSYFGNYEGNLPAKEGRSYTECDIDTLGKSSRGAKRIVFSNDGLIYYTGDHYQTFELLYGEES